MISHDLVERQRMLEGLIHFVCPRVESLLLGADSVDTSCKIITKTKLRAGDDILSNGWVGGGVIQGYCGRQLVCNGC